MQLDFMGLISRPIEEKNSEAKLRRDWRSDTVKLINNRSSAKSRLFKHFLFMKQPRLDFSRIDKILSINAVKRRGDRIPPCLTPDDRVTVLERVSFHLILADDDDDDG